MFRYFDFAAINKWPSVGGLKLPPRTAMRFFLRVVVDVEGGSEF